MTRLFRKHVPTTLLTMTRWSAAKLGGSPTIEISVMRRISPSRHGANHFRPVVLPLLEEVLTIPRQWFWRHQYQPNSMGSYTVFTAANNRRKANLGFAELNIQTPLARFRAHRSNKKPQTATNSTPPQGKLYVPSSPQLQNDTEILKTQRRKKTYRIEINI